MYPGSEQFGTLKCSYIYSNILIKEDLNFWQKFLPDLHRSYKKVRTRHVNTLHGYQDPNVSKH